MRTLAENVASPLSLLGEACRQTEVVLAEIPLLVGIAGAIFVVTASRGHYGDTGLVPYVLVSVAARRAGAGTVRHMR